MLRREENDLGGLIGDYSQVMAINCYFIDNNL